MGHDVVKYLVRKEKKRCQLPAASCTAEPPHVPDGMPPMPWHANIMHTAMLHNVDEKRAGMREVHRGRCAEGRAPREGEQSSVHFSSPFAEASASTGGYWCQQRCNVHVPIQTQDGPGRTILDQRE